LKFSKFIETIDSHTFGEPTRSIIAGVPRLKGDTMTRKQEYFKEHCDWIRTMTMLEPRGGNVMSGAVITEPCMEEADVGVIFIDSGGYFPMCGHSTIGVTTMLVETGMVPVIEPCTTVKLETPAGLVTAVAQVEGGRVKSVTFENIPCFLYESKTLFFEGAGAVSIDVAYGGGSFALVPAQAFGIKLVAGNLPEILRWSKIIQDRVNEDIGFRHPEKPEICGVSQVHWYSPPVEREDVDARSVNVFLPGVDRSPCGTGTSARAVTLFVQGKLGLGEEFSQESLTGGKFTAKIKQSVSVGGYPGAVPTLTGAAHITGFHKFVVDSEDSLAFGFPF
jgi:proline racemase